MLQVIRKEIENLLHQCGVKGKIEISVPPTSEMGDLSLPCFDLAKKIGKNPAEIARDLAYRFISYKLQVISKVDTAGPYVNFTLNPAIVAEMVLSEIVNQNQKYGQSKIGRGKKIMIEYSSPNTHKEFHIGHLRNVCLGSALVNLYQSSGYKIVPVNYINDFGLHVAQCLWGLDKFHHGEKPPKEKGRWLSQIYVEAVRAAEGRDGYKKEIASFLAKLEKKDKEIMKIWQKTRGWSLAGFKKIYQELGANFVHVFFESEVKDRGKAVVSELLKKGVARKGEGGAVIVDLKKFGLDIFLILKSDGAGLYATSDLALAFEKFRRFKIDEAIYVVDVRQSLYLKQVFKTLELYGFRKPMKHISYEFVRLPEGTMASRLGRVILYEDLRDEMVAYAVVETKKRHSDWSSAKIKKTALSLALGAMKFGMLKINPQQVITFNIKEALSFDGCTGPYLQYSLARINSILRKNKEPAYRTGRQRTKNKKNQLFLAPCSLLFADIEKQLLLKIAAFPEIIQQSTQVNDPSHLAKYLYELAKTFSDFYEACPVLKAESEELRLARLEIIKAVKLVLEKGLGILGVPVVEEM